jgi:hypothetical protein
VECELNPLFLSSLKKMEESLPPYTDISVAAGEEDAPSHRKAGYDLTSAVALVVSFAAGIVCGWFMFGGCV